MQDDKRTYPPRVGDERVSLSGFLQFQRETLARKCAGLTTEQLRERAVPASELTLLGLVRHLAEAERSWFRQVLKGEVAPPHWPGPDPGEFAEFDVETADPDEAFRIWHEECARSRATVEAADSLEINGSYGDDVFSLRYILTHMIEEYARHNGHADLLREAIDGATGA
ncbi:DinB family protein [Streptomyces sp. NPDC097727]|uniref:DinB family protein n=1 Tax=Streptomyces sp. NPDC097727 TaxID=3366092 RepID=UPI003823A975